MRTCEMPIPIIRLLFLFTYVLIIPVAWMIWVQCLPIFLTYWLIRSTIGWVFLGNVGKNDIRKILMPLRLPISADIFQHRCNGWLYINFTDDPDDIPTLPVLFFLILIGAVIIFFVNKLLY